MKRREMGTCQNRAPKKTRKHRRVFPLVSCRFSYRETESLGGLNRLWTFIRWRDGGWLRMCHRCPVPQSEALEVCCSMFVSDFRPLVFNWSLTLLDMNFHFCRGRFGRWRFGRFRLARNCLRGLQKASGLDVLKANPETRVGLG